MMALTGHVATTVPPVGEDTHTVEYTDGELAADALTDADRVALAAGDATPPLRETLTDGDAAAPRDALTDVDASRDTDGDTDGVTTLHCA